MHPIVSPDIYSNMFSYLVNGPKMYPVQVLEVIVIGFEKIPENLILHKHQKQVYFIYILLQMRYPSKQCVMF